MNPYSDAIGGIVPTSEVPKVPPVFLTSNTITYVSGSGAPEATWAKIAGWPWLRPLNAWSFPIEEKVG